ncbi:HAMP domain-containing histidine kinase [Microbacterium radiodurans]|uniref:histidine kinase n=2 Tax=Microbacterium radiodurans TaxID=661398 RepID=A0A5J5IXH2_9MICO|nr:HAMP domain-containing histidine kinase [Microbacterium radiodurans]
MRRPRSLRARITLLATVAVAIVMIVGSLAFHLVLSASIHAATERAAETRAEELAARIATGGPGVVAAIEDDAAQLIDDAGRVIAASDDADDRALPRVESGRVVDVDGDALLLVREDVDGGNADGGRELILGVSVEDDRETLATVAMLLTVSTIAVVGVVAGVTWWVVGRSLRPVARIRAEVEAITADRLDRRVAEPPSGDEIAALAVTMNRMLDRLDSASAAQGRFVADASHELRSPLATIRQHAELARAHPEASSLDDLAGVVTDEGARMQHLVDALLLLARLDEQAPRRADAVDLDDIALAEVARLRSRGVAVDASGIGAARVTGDPRLLGQLVRNLADNAARHAVSRVAIAVGHGGDRVVLTVDDDGTGIPEDERSRVFERFVRLDEGRARDAGGSGLGLAIVHGVATSAGGSVAIGDGPLGGARFTVELPAASGS